MCWPSAVSAGSSSIVGQQHVLSKVYFPRLLVPIASVSAPLVDFAIAFARIENHFFVHAGGLEEGQLIRDAGKLKGIPGTIVHGRYDVVTPVKIAYDLAMLRSFRRVKPLN